MFMTLYWVKKSGYKTGYTGWSQFILKHEHIDRGACLYVLTYMTSKDSLDLHVELNWLKPLIAYLMKKLNPF